MAPERELGGHMVVLVGVTQLITDCPIRCLIACPITCRCQTIPLSSDTITCPSRIKLSDDSRMTHRTTHQIGRVSGGVP